MFRPYSKEQQVGKKKEKKQWKPKRKPTGEGKIFAEIWDEREHVCSNVACRKTLRRSSSFWHWFFAHIIPKSRGEKYRKDKTNIALLCEVCHDAFDNRCAVLTIIHYGKQIIISRNK